MLPQLDALKSADAGAVFAELIRAGLQALIEAEATETIGAGRYHRTDGRATHRNGHRPKTVSTASGDIEVQVPCAPMGFDSATTPCPNLTDSAPFHGPPMLEGQYLGSDLKISVVVQQRHIMGVGKAGDQ